MMKKYTTTVLFLYFYLIIEAQIAIPLTKLEITQGVFSTYIHNNDIRLLKNKQFEDAYQLDSSNILKWNFIVYFNNKYDTIVYKFIVGVKGNDKYILPLDFPEWQPAANKIFIINEKDSSQLINFKKQPTDKDIYKIHIYPFIKNTRENLYPVGKIPFVLSYGEYYSGELYHRNKNYKLFMSDLTPIRKKGDVVDFRFMSKFDTFTSKRYGDRDSNLIEIESSFFKFKLSNQLDTLYLYSLVFQKSIDTLNALLVFDLRTNLKVDIIKNRKKDYLFIDLWGTWCAACIKDMPNLVAKYDKYSKNIEFVSIAFDSNLEKIPEILRKNNINWSQYYLSNTTNSWFDKYSGMGFPGVIILNKKNRIIFDSNALYEDIKIESILESTKK